MVDKTREEPAIAFIAVSEGEHTQPVETDPFKGLHDCIVLVWQLHRVNVWKCHSHLIKAEKQLANGRQPKLC